LQDQYLVLFQGRVFWRAALSGDCQSLIHSALTGVRRYLRISALFILWKIRCKSVFEHEVSSLSAFCTMWHDEERNQLLAKGALLIKAAHP
jgi:hypothetical protein